LCAAVLCDDFNLRSQMKEQITGQEATVARRRRLPRCIRGDRTLTPFAAAPALGLALLHNSGVGPLSSLLKGAGTPLSLSTGSSDGSSGGDGVGDAYEMHLTLPMGNVAMLTNYRLLMLLAPEFAVLESEVLSGRRSQVSPRAACSAADWKVACLYEFFANNETACGTMAASCSGAVVF
jgi:hypothetical protein